MEPQVAKLTAMFAAGDNVDVFPVTHPVPRELHRAGDRRAHRRSSRGGGLRRGLHRVHPADRGSRRQYVGPALLLHGLDLHVQRRAAEQGGVRGSTVHDLRGARRAVPEGEAGRGGEVPDAVGRGGSASSSFPAPGSASPTIAAAPYSTRDSNPSSGRARLHAKPCAGGRRPSPSTRSRTRIR